MKKPFKHTELSDKVCKCGARLKKNLLAKRINAKNCYKCTRLSRNQKPRAKNILI